MLIMPSEKITYDDLLEENKRLREIIHAGKQEREKAENALKAREENIRYILKHNPNAIAVYDNNLHYLLVSDRYLKDYKVEDKEIIGKHHYEVFPEMPERWRKIHQRVLKGEILRSNNDYFVRENGEVTYNRWECRPWYNSDGTIGGMITYTEVITERKLAELALKENQEKFRTLVEQMADGLLLHDLEGNIVDVNQASVNQYGYPREEMLKMNLRDIDPDYDKREDKGTFYDKMSYNRSARFEARQMRSNKEIFPAEVTLTKILIKERTYIMGLCRDISERKNAETKLKQSEEKFRSFVENANDIIYQVDSNGVFIYASPNWTEILGYQIEEVIGEKVAKFVHPEDVHLCMDFLQEVLTTGKKQSGVEYRVQHKNGSWRWHVSNASPLKDPEGIPVSYLGIARDITDERTAAKHARIINERYKKAQEIGNVGNWEYYIHEDSFWGSEQAKRIYGLDLNTDIFASKEIYDCIPKKEIVKQAIAELIQKNKPFEIKHEIIRCNDKKKRIISSKAELEYDGTGKLLKITGYLQDITEREQYEKELIIAKEQAEESSRLKTEFLNNMSHEIRTPMNGIMGFSRMLDDPSLSDEKRNYYSKIVQNSSQQLLKTIDDILEISTLETKQEKLNLTVFCLNDLLLEIFSIISLQSKERNIPLYLHKEFQDDQSNIYSDKLKLTKIITNLLENALKFTHEGFIEFGYYLKEPMLVLYVKDTGIGISAKNHQVIFERFSQEEKEISRKHGGLGLGLSISKENAQLLEGDITLESEKGKGSTFYVTIPYKPVPGDSNTDSGNHITDSGAGKKYTVLVAEDEEINYLYLEALFENQIEENYVLLHAKNGKEAVDMCTENNYIDLVLMDIKMPVLNGHQAATEIKARYPNMPIIAQTAYSTESDKEEALKHGCDDFISKPINKKELFGLMKKHLDISWQTR